MRLIGRRVEEAAALGARTGSHSPGASGVRRPAGCTTQASGSGRVGPPPASGRSSRGIRGGSYLPVDRREEFRGPDRLGEVVVHPGREAVVVVFLPRRRQGDDGQVSPGGPLPLPDRSHDLEAVEFRHVEVQEQRSNRPGEVRLRHGRRFRAGPVPPGRYWPAARGGPAGPAAAPGAATLNSLSSATRMRRGGTPVAGAASGIATDGRASTGSEGCDCRPNRAVKENVLPRPARSPH